MRVTVAEAQKRLTDLIGRAEASQDAVLSRDDHSAVRGGARCSEANGDKKKAVGLERVWKSAAANKAARPGPSIARSQDFLDDEIGLTK